MKNNSNKNMLIGALIVVVLGLGYLVAKQSTQKKGVSIEVSEDGINIQEN